MKNNILISLLVVAMGVIVFMGCEKPETDDRPTAIAHQVTDNPQGSTTPVTHNTTLSFTGCHSSQSRDDNDPIVSMIYENEVLLLNIDNFRVCCAMDSVLSELNIDNQTIDVNLKENSYAANCICPVDVNYSIDNIKVGTYELILRHADLVFYQEEIICE